MWVTPHARREGILRYVIAGFSVSLSSIALRMFCRTILLLSLLFAARTTGAPALPPPLWKARHMTADPLFFVQAEGAAAASALLYAVPDAPPLIRSATHEVTYESGRDYTWKPGSAEVTLTAGSRIPFKTTAQLHPAPNSPNSYNGCRDGKSWMLYGDGRYFHDLQCSAAYDCAKAEWRATIPTAAPAEQLPHLRAKLKPGTAIKLVTLGDSISTGANSSGSAGAPPMQPGYHELTAQALEQKFGVKVTARNLSVGGMDAAWGLQQAKAVNAESPDLLLLAFGMNDASGKRTAAAFTGLISETIAMVKAAHPKCDVIVISPMTANAEWIHAAPEAYPAYALALQGIAGPGCAAADVTSIWTAVAARKNYLSLSGNGLNHPNDFGHRLYADVIMAVIGEP